MNKSDYVSKMLVILNDETKFQTLGPVDTHDKTPSVEASLNNFLNQLRKNGEIDDGLLEGIRAVGSMRPRLYGLPKVHKSGCPLSPILSMTGAPQYAASKWLCPVLEPVLKLYNNNCVQDSFTFADMIKSKPIPSTARMCSLDLVSLCTNVPLEETIDIFADAIYLNDELDHVAPALSESSFVSCYEWSRLA